jgi:adenosylhomocysteine nucleosidase
MSTLGILSAMPQELDAVLAMMSGVTTTSRAGRTFHRGLLEGVPAVAVFSRWGKVAAASTATELLIGHGVSRIVFTGVAGGLAPDVAVGDIVIAHRLWQHDLDASPLYPRGEIPLLGVAAIESDPALRQALTEASQAFIRDELSALKSPMLARTPRVHLGDIASGDRFIASDSARADVLAAVPTALCVEMEGAAVAQVCHEHGIPFACVRTISDTADAHAAGTVMDFINALAGVYSAGIISRAAKLHA